MKYTFVMPYYRRAKQLQNTLASFRHLYSGRSDWEIVLIEDPKNDDAVSEIVAHQVNQIQHVMGRSAGPNPTLHYNLGALAGSGGILILTSPECLHWSDVLGAFDEEMDEDVYAVAACISARDCGTYKAGAFEYSHHMWYQRTDLRDLRYHWCTALRRETFWRLGGFDERFAHGIAYDDDAWLLRVMRAGLPFRCRDDAVVIHQAHDKSRGGMPFLQQQKLLARNRRLFEEIKNAKQRAEGVGPSVAAAPGLNAPG